MQVLFDGKILICLAYLIWGRERERERELINNTGNIINIKT